MALRKYAFISALFLCATAHAESDGSLVTTPDNSCNAISGLYQVAGEYVPASPQHAKARMDWTLFLKEFSGRLSAIELVWDGTGKSLSARIHGENLAALEKLNFTIKASCLNGGLVYAVDHDGYSEGGTRNKTRLNAKLSKDGSGNLVVDGVIHVESSDLLVINRTREDEIHARFSPIVKAGLTSRSRGTP